MPSTLLTFEIYLPVAIFIKYLYNPPNQWVLLQLWDLEELIHIQCTILVKVQPSEAPAETTDLVCINYTKHKEGSHHTQ